MIKKTSISQKHNSVAVASAYGACIGIAIGLLLSALLAFLINNNSIAYEMIGMISPIILYVSHAMGGLIGAIMSKEKKAIVALICIAVSFFILGAGNILFMDGAFHGILPKLLSGLLAYGTIFLILLRGEGGKKRSIKIRSR